MKSLKQLGVILLSMLLIMPFSEVDAQKQKRQKETSKTFSSHIDIYAGGGYSALLHGIDGTSVPGGGAGMLGFGYLMKHKSNFNFKTGLEFMFLNSTTKLDPFSYSGDFIYSDANKQNHTMLYMMDFANYKEQQNRLSLNIPVLFGAEIKQFYFLAGAKLGVSMLDNYAMSSVVTTMLRDPELVDDLGNMPTHDLREKDVKFGGDLKLGLDIAVSAEVGVCLDQWMPESAKSFGSGSQKKSLSYRLGAFVDYGVMNINNNVGNDMLLNFPGIKPLGDGSFEVPVKNISQVENHSIVSVRHNGELAALNSFVVGAKFTILMGVDKAPKVINKRKPKRPLVNLIRFVPDPTFFYMYVKDADTKQPLSAEVSLFALGEEEDVLGDTVFVGMTDSVTGFVEEQIDNDAYGIHVTSPGYVEFSDTLFQVISDTMYLELQPIKEDKVIILRNLLFDTNKTTIRNVSAPSLEELYQLLLNNPDMRIRITGHTDNVGTERYNKRLSEGRAKAVYDEMVKRGIDASRMEWEGRGSQEPIDTNDTEEGRATNRRVAFTILSE